MEFVQYDPASKGFLGRRRGKPKAPPPITLYQPDTATTGGGLDKPGTLSDASISTGMVPPAPQVTAPFADSLGYHQDGALASEQPNQPGAENSLAAPLLAINTEAEEAEAGLLTAPSTQSQSSLLAEQTSGTSELQPDGSNAELSPRIASGGDCGNDQEEDEWEGIKGSEENEEDEEEDEDEGWEGIDGAGRSIEDNAGTSTWRGRNPDKAVIPLRKGRKKQTAETLATAKIKRSLNKRRSQELQADIDAIHDARNKMAEEVASKHSIKVEIVLRRLMAKGSVKTTRRVNLFNAKVHHLAKRLKSSKEDVSFEELKRRARDDSDFEDLTPEKESALRAELLADREVAKSGARATNIAAATDARATIASIADEINNLAARTGMVGFAMFSRGHIHDRTIPTECQSLGALDFFGEIMGEDARDVAAKFELWSVARDHGMTGVDSLRSMRKEVTKYIMAGLREKAGRTKIAMNYAQYRRSIVLKFGICLKGWPLDGEPINPNAINDIDTIRKVRDALRCGDCFWYKMSPAEREQSRSEYEELVASGEIEEVKRKQRSDKNKPRKGVGSGPVSTRSKAPNAPKRRVWADDDTEDDGEGSERQARRKRVRKEGDGGERRKKDGEKQKGKRSRREKENRNDDDGSDSDNGDRPRKRQKASERRQPASSQHRSSTKSTQPKSRFETFHERLTKLSRTKASRQVPPSMHRCPDPEDGDDSE